MSTKPTGIYIIYKATSPSGKCYIGYTSGTLANRKNEHEYLSKTSCRTKFHKALKKYNLNFNWEVLVSSKNKLDAYEIEQELISFYDTKNNGYNLSDGGLGPSGNTFNNVALYKSVIRLDTLEIYESAVIASKSTGCSVADISSVCRERRKHAKGIVFKFYKKENIYLKQDKFKINHNGSYECKSQRIKKIKCLEDLKVFNSVKELCNYYSITKSKFYHSIRGTGKKLSLTFIYL